MDALGCAEAGTAFADLRAYLDRGKLMSVATTDGTELAMCSVWYAMSADRLRLYFTSRATRTHSTNVRDHGVVAGSILAIDLEGPGQKTQGVFFAGRATEAHGVLADECYRAYSGRWPQFGSTTTLDDIISGASPLKMYVIDVAKYVWFDEVGRPNDPRVVVTTEGMAGEA